MAYHRHITRKASTDKLGERRPYLFRMTSHAGVKWESYRNTTSIVKGVSGSTEKGIGGSLSDMAKDNRKS